MGFVSERIHSIKIRVFKRYETLEEDKVSKKQGLAMLRVSNDITRKDCQGRLTTDTTEQNEVFKFDFQSLYSLSSIRSLFRGIALVTQLFSEASCLLLGDTIYSYLASNFTFTNQTSSRRHRPKPILVFVADVHMLRVVDNAGQEASDIATPRGDKEYDIGIDDIGTDDIGIGVDVDIDEDYDESTSTAQCRDGNEDEDQGDDDDDDDEDEEALIEEDVTVDEENLEVVENQELSDIAYILKIFLEEPMPIPQPRGFKEVEPAVKIMELEFDDEIMGKHQCSICIEKFVKGSVLAIMPCSHSFHRHCAFRWLPRNSTCPLCRMDCTTMI